MRRLVGWIGGAVGGIAAYRLVRRRSQAAAEPVPSEAEERADERAEELRAKLAESKLTESPAPESRAPEPAVEDTLPEAEAEPTPEAEAPEDRRRRVHEEGRSTLDEMKSDGAGD